MHFIFIDDKFSTKILNALERKTIIINKCCKGVSHNNIVTI